MQDSVKALGIKCLLNQYFSITATIANNTDVIESMGENVDYIFTDPETYAACIRFFIPRQAKTIVVAGTAGSKIDSDVTMLCSSDDITTITDNLSLFFDRQGNDGGVNDGILSSRETDVLRLVASGLMNKEIAERLNISINTVLTHRKNITAKLGIKSTSGLSVYALMNGIIAQQEVKR